MKFYIDGEEISSDTEFEIDQLSDRLIVHTPEGAFSAVAIRDGDAVLVSYKGRQYRLETKLNRVRAGSGVGSGELRAPMPGLIVDVLVSVGEAVTKGQKVAVLEAMKTQQPFLAPFDGVVETLSVVKGQQVEDGQAVAIIGAPK